MRSRPARAGDRGADRSQLHWTVDAYLNPDWTYPLRVYLMHENESTVLHDIMTARYVDGEGFYEVV